MRDSCSEPWCIHQESDRIIDPTLDVFVYQLLPGRPRYLAYKGWYATQVDTEHGLLIDTKFPRPLPAWPRYMRSIDRIVKKLAHQLPDSKNTRRSTHRVRVILRVGSSRSFATTYKDSQCIRGVRPRVPRPTELTKWPKADGYRSKNARSPSMSLGDLQQVGGGNVYTPNAYLVVPSYEQCAR